MRGKILALVTLLAACAGSTPKPSEAPAGINLEVVTLDPGAEPREEVRYHGASGRTERLLLRLSLADFVQTRDGAAAGQTPLLDLVMHVGATYLGEGGGGLWGYPLRFEMIGVRGVEDLNPEELEVLNTELAPIARTTGVFEIDDRGITRSASVSIPTGASPRILTMLGNIRTTLLAAALPKEAIGVGARWQAERIISVGGMKVPQTVTYTLLERDEDVLRIGISMHQSAKPQQFPMTADGVTMSLEQYEVNAVGSTVVDLHGFAPLSEMHAVSQLRATLTKGTAVEPVAVSGDLTILIAPLPKDLAPKAPEPAAPAPADPAPAAAAPAVTPT